MNIIAWLEYKLAYYDFAVYHFNHYTMRTPHVLQCCPCYLKAELNSIYVWNFMMYFISIEHQWIALTFKPIVTWLAPWKASQLKLTSFIKECMSSMRTACGLAHFTRMDLSNSFAWVVSIHLFILNRITEGGLFGYTLLS